MPFRLFLQVDETIAYLIRRVEENSTMMGGDAVLAERHMLRRELYNRLTNTDLTMPWSNQDQKCWLWVCRAPPWTRWTLLDTGRRRPLKELSTRMFSDNFYDFSLLDFRMLWGQHSADDNAMSTIFDGLFQPHSEHTLRWRVRKTRLLEWWPLFKGPFHSWLPL